MILNSFKSTSPNSYIFCWRKLFFFKKKCINEYVWPLFKHHLSYIFCLYVMFLLFKRKVYPSYIILISAHDYWQTLYGTVYDVLQIYIWHLHYVNDLFGFNHALNALWHLQCFFFSFLYSILNIQVIVRPTTIFIFNSLLVRLRTYHHGGGYTYIISNHLTESPTKNQVQIYLHNNLGCNAII